MATYPATRATLDGSTVKFTYSGACDPNDIISVALATETSAPAQLGYLIYLRQRFTGGSVTKSDPEAHNATTPTSATRVWKGTWGTDTPGLVFHAGLGTGEPIPCVDGNIYHRPQPDASGGTLTFEAYYRRAP